MEKYELMRKIGHGSFGDVLLVRCRANPSVVCVIKVVPLLQTEHGASKKAQESASKEAELLSSLSHPYIVHYRQSFVENGRLHIVMDYASGGDLHGRILRTRAKHGAFDEAVVLRWFVQLCLAVNFLHERHILHRDLKSRNVFLDGHEPGSVRLGDFGIARVLQNKQDLASTSIGTPCYVVRCQSE